jgi:hypothetical protein
LEKKHDSLSLDYFWDGSIGTSEKFHQSFHHIDWKHYKHVFNTYIDLRDKNEVENSVKNYYKSSLEGYLDEFLNQTELFFPYDYDTTNFEGKKYLK